MFEVYIYFDPRIQQEYNIENIKFNYRPVYVGKGNISHKRKCKHVRKTKYNNTKLVDLNTHLLSIGIQPCCITVFTTNDESVAFSKERELIKLIGREDLCLGPLFNLTDGGEGTSGKIYTEEERKQRSTNTQNYFNNLTYEQRRLHGKKSLDSKTPEIWKAAALKSSATKSLFSNEKRKSIESRRYTKWKEKYYSHTPERKQLISKRCSIASLKNKVYFFTFLEDGIERKAYLKDMLDEGYARDGIMYRVKGKVRYDLPFKSRTTKKIIQLISHTKLQYQN